MMRLFAAIAVISLSGFLSLEYWPVHALLVVLLWGLASLAGAHAGAMLARLALFLPFVLAIAVGVPGTQAGEWDWQWPLTILCRSLVAFFSGVWLVQVLPFPELLSTMRRMHVPEVFVASLAFMHRYAAVLWEELARLKIARSARSSRLGWRRQWITSTQIIGELVIRAWDRADRIHRAMLARGGDQTALPDRPSR